MPVFPGPVCRHLHFPKLNNICHFSDHLTNLAISSCIFFISNFLSFSEQFSYHLPPGYLSLRKEEPLPELSPQTPVSGYSWPRRTQVADKAVSPSCFRSSLPSCPFSWCPLSHSFCPSVVFESCNVSRPSMYSLLDNVYDIIYTCLMSYPGITFVVT